MSARRIAHAAIKLLLLCRLFSLSLQSLFIVVGFTVLLAMCTSRVAQAEHLCPAFESLQKQKARVFPTLHINSTDGPVL